MQRQNKKNYKEKINIGLRALFDYETQHKHDVKCDVQSSS